VLNLSFPYFAAFHIANVTKFHKVGCGVNEGANVIINNQVMLLDGLL